MSSFKLTLALADDNTTAIILNGGTEQRGPRGVTGAHTLIAQKPGIEIAKQFGNAIVGPVIPFPPSRANPAVPGAIGISNEPFAQLNEEVAEQTITNGLKNIVLLGDHGGRTGATRSVARKLSEKYAENGIRVVHCNKFYDRVETDSANWLADNGYALGHKGWGRKDLIATAVGDPVRKAGEPRDPNAKRVNNGIEGDAGRSTPEIGKRLSEMKVNYAVDQIRRLLK